MKAFLVITGQIRRHKWIAILHRLRWALIFDALGRKLTLVHDLGDFYTDDEMVGVRRSKAG